MVDSNKIIRMLVAGLVLVLLKLSGSRGDDAMMGGHIDNKEKFQEKYNKPEMEVEHRSGHPDSNLELEFLSDDDGGGGSSNSNIDGQSSSSVSYSWGKNKVENGDESSFAPAKYRVLPYAFNGGQPFSLEKDPITGKIDFEKAPPLKVLQYTAVKNNFEKAEYEDKTENNVKVMNNKTSSSSSSLIGAANEINPYPPNLHDFLNLPVRYTYEKSPDKYPLISSSYANTKVQSGPNSYNTYNHKKYDEIVESLYIEPSTPKTTTMMTTTTTTPAASTTTTTISSIVRSSSEIGITGGEAGPSFKGDNKQEDEKEIRETGGGGGELIFTKGETNVREDDSSSDEYEIYEDEESVDDYDDDIAGEKGSIGGYSHGHYYNDMTYGINRDEEREDTNGPVNTKNRTITRNGTNLVSINRFEITTTATSMSTKKEEEKEERVTSMPIDAIPAEDKFQTIINGNSNNNNEGSSSSSSTTTERIKLVEASTESQQLNNKMGYVDPAYSFEEGAGSQAAGAAGTGATVLKSTSNVVVPHGQDTVSFVLGNRQSVTSAMHQADANNNLLMRGSGAERGGTPPVVPSSPSASPPKSLINNNNNYYSGEMIVSAGIGVGSPPDSPQSPAYPSALLSYLNHGFQHPPGFGMPSVDIVNTAGNTHQNANSRIDNNNNNNNNNIIKNKWWWNSSSTINTNNNNKEQQRVVFPEEASIINHEKRPLDEEISSIDETVNTSQQQQQSAPTTMSFRFETTTQKLLAHNRLPELSENLTPPAAENNVATLFLKLPEEAYSGTFIKHAPTSTYNTNNNNNNKNNQHHFYHQHQSGSLIEPVQNNNPALKRIRPSVENNLPNILPQFRPNAKTSHGHNRAETIGTILAGGAAPPPPPPASYVNSRIRRPSTSVGLGAIIHNRGGGGAPSRRPNLPHNHHHNLQRLSPPPAISSLRLPTASSLHHLNSNNNRHQQQHNSRVSASIKGQTSASVTMNDVQQRRRHDNNRIKSRLDNENNGDEIEEDEANLERYSMEPPTRRPYLFSIINNINSNNNNNNKEERRGEQRIATLQMIHAAGVREAEVVVVGSSDKHQVSSVEDEDKKKSTTAVVVEEDDNVDKSAERSPDAVYIVYPVEPAYLDENKEQEAQEEEEQVVNEDASVVVGTYGSQRPLPPETLLQDSHEQQHRDNIAAPAGQPILITSSTVINYGNKLASDFPYPLERPDPSMFTSELREKPLLVPSEHHHEAEEHHHHQQQQQQLLHLPKIHKKLIIDENFAGDTTTTTTVYDDSERDTSVNVIPYLQDHVPFGLEEKNILSTITVDRPNKSKDDTSSTPIAYVYTPTTMKSLDTHYGKIVERAPPVLLPSQQPSSSSSSAPSPQSFMAPFVASASAEAPSNNGWSVVILEHKPHAASTDEPTTAAAATATLTDIHHTSSPRNTSENIDEINNYNDNAPRIKSAETDGSDHHSVTRTDKPEFDVENFTPQLFGGFRPILQFSPDALPIIQDKLNSDSIVERPRSRID